MTEQAITLPTWSFGEDVAVRERPTGEVKWFPRSMFQAHDRELYQRWEIETFSGSKPMNRRYEWRKVGVGSLDELTV